MCSFVAQLSPKGPHIMIVNSHILQFFPLSSTTVVRYSDQETWYGIFQKVVNHGFIRVFVDLSIGIGHLYVCSRNKSIITTTIPSSVFRTYKFPKLYWINIFSTENMNHFLANEWLLIM